MTREISLRAIDRQLGELTDENLVRLRRDLEMYLKGQLYKELGNPSRDKVEQYLNQKTHEFKKAVVVGAKVEIISNTVEIPSRKKRPRIKNAKVDIDSTLKIMDANSDNWMEEHMAGLRQMTQEHLTQ